MIIGRKYGEENFSFDIKETFHSKFFNKANLVMLDDPTTNSTESS